MLEPLLGFLSGYSTTIKLSVCSADDNRLNPTQLNLQVMRSELSSICRWKRLERVDDIYITADIIQAECYLIVPRSLPTIDEFDTFGRTILLMQDAKSHSGPITRLLDLFLSAYCSRGNHTRLVNLIIPSPAHH